MEEVEAECSEEDSDLEWTDVELLPEDEELLLATEDVLVW